MSAFDNLLARALTVMNERVLGMNTNTRIGSLFRDILYFINSSISNLVLGIIIKGEKENEAVIKAISNPQRGDAWKATDTGHYWLFDGSQWNDIGEVIPSDMSKYAMNGGSSKTIQDLDDNKADKTNPEGNEVVYAPDGEINVSGKIEVVKDGDVITKDGQYLMADNGVVKLETGTISEEFDYSQLTVTGQIQSTNGQIGTSQNFITSPLLPIDNIVAISSKSDSVAGTAMAVAFYQSNESYIADASISFQQSATMDAIKPSNATQFRVSSSIASPAIITLHRSSTVIAEIENKNAITLISVVNGIYSSQKLQDIPENNLMYGTPDTIAEKGYNYLVDAGVYDNFRNPVPEIFDNSLANIDGYILFADGTDGGSVNFVKTGYLPIENIVKFNVKSDSIAGSGAAVAFYDNQRRYLPDISINFLMAHTQDAIPDNRVSFYRLVFSKNDYTVTTVYRSDAAIIEASGWGVMKYMKDGDFWEYNPFSFTQEETSEDIQQHLVYEGEKDFKANTFRIPCVEITNKGTLICISEARYNNMEDAGQPIETVIKRSINNGKTWINSRIAVDRDTSYQNSRVNCGSITVDRDTGRIYIFVHKIDSDANDASVYTDGWWQANSDLVYIYSDDDGISWSESESIKTTHPEIYPEETVTIASASSANGITMKDGTVAIPIQIRRTSTNTGTTGIARFNNAFIYLKPEDKKTLNWKRSSVIEMGWNGEPSIMEYEPGKLLINARSGKTGINRRVYSTDDLGTTWSLHPSDQTIVAPQNNASVEMMLLGNTYFEKRYYLYSNCDMPQDGSPTQRVNPSLWVSLDLLSWQKVLQLYAGQSWGYTCIAYYNGKLAIAYETKGDIYVSVINPYLVTANYFQ